MRKNLLISLCFGIGTLISTQTFSAIAEDNSFGKIVPAGAQDGDLHLEPCEIFLEGDQKSYPGDCGTLVVKENRNNPNSRLIPLPVRRIKALGDNPTEPIFWLEGGPGGPNNNIYPTDGILQNHDFIMVGYRGIEGEVILDCTELADAVLEVEGSYIADDALDSYGRATKACADRYIASGVDLDGYSMNHTIDDNEAVRKAMGYDRINLFGNSYGTRVEILYQWRHPDSIHRVVQVAVNPPGHFIFYPEAIEKLLHDYSALCAKDSYCSSRTSNLYETIKSVSENMPKSWFGFPIYPERVRMLTTIGLMESMATEGEGVPLNGPAFLDVWLDAAEGDASGMALISNSAPMFLPAIAARGHFLAMGGSAPDMLDPNRDYRAEFRAPHTVLGSPFSLFITGMVGGWPATSDQSVGEVLPSDVETLLINGSIDGSTPPQFGRDKLLPALSKGQIFIIKDQGHTETFWHSQPEARARLLNTYFDTGKLDGSLYEYQAVNFDADTTWGGLAKMLLSGVLAMLALLGFVIFMIVRRFRK